MQTGLRQVGDPVEDVGEPGLGGDVVQLGGADEGWSCPGFVDGYGLAQLSIRNLKD